MNLRRPKIILIGASTGGIEALTFLLKELPPKCPPILISQHILPNFCQSFATQLSKISGRPTTVITSPTDLLSGQIYVQQPETKLTFKNSITSLRCTSTPNQGGNIFRPCIDETFSNFSKSFSASTPCIAFLLTGMGSDGAHGLLSLKNSGQITITQDQASSIVYGMPKVAKQIGAATHEMSLSTIRDNILFLS